jgi:hypothetical protein
LSFLIGVGVGLALASRFRIVKRPAPKRDTASGVFEVPKEGEK